MASSLKQERKMGFLKKRKKKPKQPATTADYNERVERRRVVAGREKRRSIFLV